MTAKNSGQALHDRATRGENLAPDELAQLEAWYAEQDKAERILLCSPDVPNALAALQAQLRAALSQLLVVSQKIQEINAQNDLLLRLLLNS